MNRKRNSGSPLLKETETTKYGHKTTLLVRLYERLTLGQVNAQNKRVEQQGTPKDFNCPFNI